MSWEVPVDPPGKTGDGGLGERVWAFRDIDSAKRHSPLAAFVLVVNVQNCKTAKPLLARNPSGD
jgi:hypothetical protein